MVMLASWGRVSLSRFAPMALALLGSCVAAGAGLWLQRGHDAQASADFGRSAARVAEIVVARIERPIFGLRGVVGLFAASEQVTRRDFRAYVESRNLPQEFPGLRGFGFIQRVLRSALPAFVAAEQRDEAPQFAVRELSALDHDDLYVIKYIEPAVPNLLALGLDLGSEPIRREAVERAVDSGLPTLSAAITLVQDSRRSAGFLLFVPVFRPGTNPVTAAQRRQALVGLLYAPIVLGEMLAAVPEVAAGLIHFQLSDSRAGNTLYSSNAGLAIDATGADATGADATGTNATGADAATSGAATAGAATASAATAVGRLVNECPLALPGRDTVLRVQSTPKFDAQHDNASPWIVFVGGTLASLLLGAALAFLLRQQASLRTRAEALAEGLTADLERLAAVVRHTDNAVLTIDSRQRIDWVNEGFTRLTGFDPVQAVGQTVEALLGGGGTPAHRELAAAIASGQGCRVELPLRALHGREVWLDVDVQPLRDAQGALTGFLHIGSDVTERRRAKARLERVQRDNEALLLVIHLHAIVSVTDRSGRIVEANDAFCRISGYSRDELLQQTHRIVNSGVQPASFWVEMWRTIASGTPWRGEVCNRSKDGRLYWVETLVAPFVDGEGKIEKYVSIRTDITASKNAARDLARQRQRLNNILEGTQVGTWEGNVASGDMVVNERWTQILGYGPDELLSTTVDTWARLVHPDDLRRGSALLKQHFDGGLDFFEYEGRLQHKAGHWVWALVRGKLISRSDDGRPRWMAGTLMDITERKLSEAALHATQALLDKTGRIAGVGGWVLELEPQAIRWSDQTCRIHDLEPGHQPGLEYSTNYYAPAARAVVAQAVQHCIDSGEGFDIELPLVTAQGRSIWVRSVGELESADGRPLRLVGTIQDITARHRLEAEVRRNSEVLTSVIENLPCGLSVFDGDLQLMASNTEFRRLLDFPDALFEGPITRFEDVIRFNAERGEYGSGDAEVAVQTIVARARAPIQPHQFERVRPDGTPLEIRGGPMPGGGFVTTYTDISARHRAEAEVQRAGALLRGSIDALDDAYALFDADDRMVLCNQRYRDLYPLCADLMVAGANFEQIIRAGAERGQYAEAVGRVDDWVSERMAIHRQPSSQLTQRLGDGRILRIGERRMADGHTVGYRVDITEFVRATETALEASNAKSQFLANMSHEIRTPMNAILGMLALLKKTELTVRQADYAGKTERAARSLLRLLNDILDFSKVEAGKMTLDLHPFRPDQLLRDLAVILAASTAGKQIEVLFDIDPQLPPVLVGDALRLQKVLINLGGNAIKFTAQGEVVITVEVVQRGAKAVTLEVAVRDSGIGIAPENQQRIFSGFSQAEASTTRRFGGTGLGLAICQRLVGLMGGRLGLDSAENRGSRFHFQIELAIGDEHGDNHGDEYGGEPGGGEWAPLRLRQAVALRVLVVDDNPLARNLMGRMATGLGWQVTLADSDAAALVCLQKDGAAFDAVFIDWQMPGLDGWQTCEQIRHGGQVFKTPLLIMVTAHGCDMLSQRSDEEQARADGFLVKPVTASMLYDAVVDARVDRHALAVTRPASTAAGQRLAGLRLLVVEDNANNQQVARELLEDEGAEVQLADNGLLAVEAVAAADPPFDIVLMDLQMPVMDGYTATTRIRQDLQQLALPIVAMTANVMATDREACLAVGMNDHVGKPFDLDHLVVVLRRLAGRPDMAASARPGQQTTLAPASPLPAPVRAAALAAGVDIDRALARLGGKRQVYGRTLRSFTADLRSLPSQLVGQLQRGERDALRRELHTLKGVAATVGATALAALASAAESRLASDSPAADEAGTVARIGAAIDQAAASLEVLCAALDGGQAAATSIASPTFATSATCDSEATALTTADTALLASLLRTVQGLLQASDLDAADALQTLLARLPAAAGARLDALETAVESLDFESALSHCSQWLRACET